MINGLKGTLAELSLRLSILGHLAEMGLIDQDTGLPTADIKLLRAVAEDKGWVEYDDEVGLSDLLNLRELHYELVQATEIVATARYEQSVALHGDRLTETVQDAYTAFSEGQTCTAEPELVSEVVLRTVEFLHGLRDKYNMEGAVVNMDGTIYESGRIEMTVSVDREDITEIRAAMSMGFANVGLTSLVA